MAFFNLTHLGPQDPFRTATGNHDPLLAAKDSETASESQDRAREHSTTTCQGQDSTEDQLHRTRHEAGADQSGDIKTEVDSSGPASTHTARMYSPSAETPWHRGSHTKYTELLRKHQRNPKGPTDLYQLPVATSHEYGWWMKDGSPQKEKWTQSERHAHVNSEMTRFVDEMSLTNKDFSLY